MRLASRRVSASSSLLVLALACESPPVERDAGTALPRDAGVDDAGAPPDAGEGGGEDAGTSDAGVAAEPANATCINAAALPFPADVDVTTRDIVTASAPSSCAAGDAFALWFSFTAPNAGRYVVTTSPDDAAFGLDDTTVALFTTCDAERVCVDDGLDTLHASALVDLSANETVLVRVAGFAGTRGDVRLRIARPEDLARPANDTCADAASLDDARVLATTLHATGADVSSCGSEDSVDVWFTFTAPSSGDFTFALSGQQTAANLVSVHGVCDDATSERACGLASATATIAAGETVFVRVGTNPDVADTFNVDVSPRGPVLAPVNDAFTAALAVGPGVVQGTTRGASDDGIGFGPSCGAFVHAAVWYSFTAPTTDRWVFDTSDSAMDDTALAIFEACGSQGGAPPTIVACDDDSGAGLRSRLDGELAAGTTVCIAIAGNRFSDDGDFTLRIAPAPAPPPNDRCVGALPLDDATLDEDGVVVADNTFARPEAVATCGAGEHALWYTFTALADGLYKFDTKASTETSADLTLFGVDASAGVDAACDDIITAEPIACVLDPKPAVTHSMSAGDSVLVRVGTNVFLRAPIALRIGPLRGP